MHRPICELARPRVNIVDQFHLLNNTIKFLHQHEGVRSLTMKIFGKMLLWFNILIIIDVVVHHEFIIIIDVVVHHEFIMQTKQLMKILYFSVFSLEINN